MAALKEKTTDFFKSLQTQIIAALEQVDGEESFITDTWERPDLEGSYGGGGITRVLRRGSVFEQAGVNFSDVKGTLPAAMSEKLTGKAEPLPFTAAGVSLVIHPFSPLVPTTHANFRFLEVGNLAWFGGGMDLTPYYLFEEDCAHFHTTIKAALDDENPSFYPKFKKWCDEYFYLPHRKETRGIGGCFYDYLGKDDPEQLETYFSMTQKIGPAFIDAYIPIVEHRKALPFSDAQKRFQLLRRGRYVEFNLLYDRGTLFGLQTNGRTESILMSLPPVVNWEYNFTPPPGSEEAKLLSVLSTPRDWI